MANKPHIRFELGAWVCLGGIRYLGMCQTFGETPVQAFNAWNEAKNDQRTLRWINGA